MSALDQRAASLNAAWRNAQDLSPVAWEALSPRDQSVWLSVAAFEMPDPGSLPVVAGEDAADTARITARRKP